MKYRIIRFYKDKNKDCKVIKNGLTLKEVKSHCSDPKTRKEGVYFDGYAIDRTSSPPTPTPKQCSTEEEI